ncbi:MAG: amino acid-binding ACT domain-containing protein [Candidatus Magnetoglobus multicellularis str. Araruama]|uniref:Amino acid-binding ACT domain-containing protein n=1 Tax=Candidatus Magnetoglobus multicellularis str. Araruama TaxID=890399 RepID=A0A1V1NW29_9BACT|nr:MAG: amino acid-binding ACT domain-containing protein [Candidatus Magnetoglobus multicellularis str. Araruama]
MVRTEISLFLKNMPGEMGKLAQLMGDNDINIDALTIQDASEYVRQLFMARGKSLKRIASSSSYQSMNRDSAEYALVRLLVNHTDKAVDLLAQKGYIFDIMPVIALEVENKPGSLAQITQKFGENNININYLYGSALAENQRYLFIFSPENIEVASEIFS